MTEDVIVIGSGLGGCIAALTVKRERPGASIRLLEPAEKRFHRNTGLIDVLGYTPPGDGPVENPLATISDLPEKHPYTLLGLDTVRAGLELFDDITGERYEGEAAEENALVATCAGNLKPTARYPAAMSAGLASDERSMLLVGFDSVTDFDAYLVSERLGDTLPYDVDSISIDFPVKPDSYPPARQFARALDENIETSDGIPVRKALAEEIRSFLDIEPRIGLPAVLGESKHEAVRQELSDRLNADIFEMPIGSPSIPGARLESLLLSRLRTAGIDRETNVSLAGFDANDSRIQRVDSQDQQFEASEFILATGGLAAGGLKADRKHIFEPVFDCHIPHTDDRDEWSAEEPLGDHPFARFGLPVDEELRPLSASGEPEYGNLRAVGSLLGGGNFVAEQSTDGVAIATGHVAGKYVADLSQ